MWRERKAEHFQEGKDFFTRNVKHTRERIKNVVKVFGVVLAVVSHSKNIQEMKLIMKIFTATPISTKKTGSLAFMEGFQVKEIFSLMEIIF